MVLVFATSKNGIRIRLTGERWNHILTSHLEITEKDLQAVIKVVSDPHIILKGDLDELVAVRKKSGSNLWFVVPYKEIGKEDGFILTAYVTNDLGWLLKKEVLWTKD